MAEPSRELLHPPSKPSILESILLGRKEEDAKPKVPTTTPVPRSQVLGKVENFLGVMAKANEQLAIDAQEKPREEIDLETLTGNEKEYIEMDLLLGVADLNTDAAVAVAESTMCGIQSTARPDTCSSSSSEEEEDESDASVDEWEKNTVESKEHVKKTKENEPKKKRQKIVVLD